MRASTQNRRELVTPRADLDGCSPIFGIDAQNTVSVDLQPLSTFGDGRAIEIYSALRPYGHYDVVRKGRSIQIPARRYDTPGSTIAGSCRRQLADDHWAELDLFPRDTIFSLA